MWKVQAVGLESAGWFEGWPRCLAQVLWFRDGISDDVVLPIVTGGLSRRWTAAPCRGVLSKLNSRSGIDDG